VKKILLSLLMLCTTFAFAAPNPADYNITVHVTASRNRLGPSSLEFNFLDVIIDGKSTNCVAAPWVCLRPATTKPG
jgi:hypothetical protein